MSIPRYVFTILALRHNITLVFRIDLLNLTVDDKLTAVSDYEECITNIVLIFDILRKLGGTLVCHLLQDLKFPGSNLDKD